jgi:hypothetical protein
VALFCSQPPLLRQRCTPFVPPNRTDHVSRCTTPSESVLLRKASQIASQVVFERSIHTTSVSTDCRSLFCCGEASHPPFSSRLALESTCCSGSFESSDRSLHSSSFCAWSLQSCSYRASQTLQYQPYPCPARGPYPRAWSLQTCHSKDSWIPVHQLPSDVLSMSLSRNPPLLSFVVRPHRKKFKVLLSIPSNLCSSSPSHFLQMRADFFNSSKA